MKSLSRKVVNKIRRDTLEWLKKSLVEQLEDGFGDWLADGDPEEDGGPEELSLDAKGMTVKVYRKNGKLAKKFRVKLTVETVK